MPATRAAKRGVRLDPKRRRLLLIGAGLAALVVVYLLYRRHAAATGKLDTSGASRPNGVGGDAQQPNGGASGVPDSLPNSLVFQPDNLQQQVQQAQGSGAGEAPTSIYNDPSFKPGNQPGPSYQPPPNPPGSYTPPAYQPPPGVVWTAPPAPAPAPVKPGLQI